MSGIKSLEITAEEKHTNSNSFDSAKQRLIQNLEIQLKCAEAMVQGKTYMLPVTKLVTDQCGETKTIQVHQAPRHWYWRDEEGSVRFCIYISNRKVEFENNRTDVLVGKDVDLPEFIMTMLQKVSEGDFDSLISASLRTLA